jgi:hypothetical protein
MLISFRALRRAIGMIGIALPIALVVGENLFGERGILDSISSYYWSEAMRDLLVGSLCAIGVFLGSYRGEKRWDSLAGNLACVFAIGVALFPCSKPMEPRTPSNYVHYSSAAGLFLTLAYYCLFSFTGQDPGTVPTEKKPIRNGVYRTCGCIILICIVAIAAVGAFPPESTAKNFVFWLEATAIWAFGWSWYIKGKGLGLIQD